MQIGRSGLSMDEWLQFSEGSGSRASMACYEASIESGWHGWTPKFGGLDGPSDGPLSV